MEIPNLSAFVAITPIFILETELKLHLALLLFTPLSFLGVEQVGLKIGDTITRVAATNLASKRPAMKY